MAKKWNFGNGRPNLHITQNAQGYQGGIIQILDQHVIQVRHIRQKT